MTNHDMPRHERLHSLASQAGRAHALMASRWVATNRWSRRAMLDARTAILLIRWSRLAAAYRAEMKAQPVGVN